MLRFAISLCCFFIVAILCAQENAMKSYRHFRGLMEPNLKLTMDIVQVGNSLSGFYHYQFDLEGREVKTIRSKTINLTGTIELAKAKLYEYNNEHTYFQINNIRKDTLKGYWISTRPEKRIPFYVVEDYSDNSLPLKYFSVTHEQEVPGLDSVDAKIPSARVSVALLYPEKGNQQLQNTLYPIIADFTDQPSEPVKEIDLLMENIAFGFLTSYANITRGIPGIEHMASFNWEKIVDMEVKFNQNNLLSIGLTKYAFTGGAHGISISKYFIINRLINKQLMIHDFIREDKMEELSEMLEDKLREMHGVNKSDELDKAGFLVKQIMATENFYIDSDGLHFYFNVYEIAPFSSGTTEVSLSFNDLKPLLKTQHPFSWVN